MKGKILVLGKGFIGERVRNAFSAEMATDRLTCFEDVDRVIAQHNPKILINCIGHTGERNVDDCEKAKDKTLFSNTYVPLLLAEAALRQKLKLIHISSGCIYHFNYGKQKSIPEERLPDFFELFYSRTKIYTEAVLQTLLKRANILIVRIRVPLDRVPHPKNILTKLIQYKTIIDVPNSVTYIPELMRSLKHLIKIDARGVFNVVGKGALRYAELMDVYKNYDPSFTYSLISLSSLKMPRTNLILSTRKLEQTGFPIKKTREILTECVQNYIKSA